MARIKFLVFVVVALLVSVLGLRSFSKGVADLAKVQTAERLAWGKLLFETSTQLAQAHRASALSDAAAQLKDWDPDGAVAAVTQVLSRLPSSLRRAELVFLANDAGVTAVPAAGGDPIKDADREAFGVSAAGDAGMGGKYALINEKLYLVAAAPMLVGGKPGWLGAAFPVDDIFAGEQARNLTMNVVISAGKAVASSLPASQRELAVNAKSGPVALEPLPSLGFGLPLFAGEVASAEAASFELEGLQNTRVVLVAETQSIVELAGFQKRALLGILAMLLLAAGVAVFIGLGEESAPAKRSRANEKTDPATKAPEPTTRTVMAPPLDQPVPTPKPVPHAPPPLPPAPPPRAPEPIAAPPLPSASEIDEPRTVAVPRMSAEELLAATNPDAALPPSFSAPPPVSDSSSNAPFDPFADAPPSDENTDDFDGGAGRTVVAAVPEQLLKATAQAAHARPAAAPPLSDHSSEEAHFQEVFQNFLSTRTQCNEPADGLTYEKFVTKLRKNKEQLVQKYGCKSVRFQVYVKEGKAALKATPVKD